MQIIGKVKVDYRTKNLIQRLQHGDIAVICHQDLDRVAATDLVSRKVKAVINSQKSVTGKYPNLGPDLLLKANIVLIDDAGEKVMKLKEGSVITLTGTGEIFQDNVLIARGRVFTREILEKELEKARQNIERALDKFIDNTLEYARKEKYFILGDIEYPETKVIFQGKHVLIVVRGNNCREDLAAIKTYIDDIKPVLVGVDGGADILWEFGYKPDLVIGDMDSVSDEVLRSAREIVVHAYPDGRAPGLERIKKLGLTARVFRCPGTSEDIAMLLSYEKGAELIVAVGSHSNMIDFLEKGRQGMASTFLVRMKTGPILVDAKGAGKLYNQRLNPYYILGLLAAALVPLITISLASPPVQYILKLLELRVRLIFG
jgi:uncharacterized membrane-anchored protein